MARWLSLVCLNLQFCLTMNHSGDVVVVAVIVVSFKERHRHICISFRPQASWLLLLLSQWIQSDTFIIKLYLLTQAKWNTRLGIIMWNEENWNILNNHNELFTWNRCLNNGPHSRAEILVKMCDDISLCVFLHFSYEYHVNNFNQAEKWGTEK